MVKVGDRVVSGYGYGIVLVVDREGLIGVRHDEPKVFFHSLLGRCEDGLGYWYRVGNVSKVKTTFKGNKHATAS